MEATLRNNSSATVNAFWTLIKPLSREERSLLASRLEDSLREVRAADTPKGTSESGYEVLPLPRQLKNLKGRVHLEDIEMDDRTRYILGK